MSDDNRMEGPSAALRNRPKPLRPALIVVSAVACLLVAGGAACASASGDTQAKSTTVPTAGARVDAFAPDLLKGDDGLPASPQLPLRHGLPSTPVDIGGDAMDAHEGQLQR